LSSLCLVELLENRRLIGREEVCGNASNVARRIQSLEIDSDFSIGDCKQRELATMRNVEVNRILKSNNGLAACFSRDGQALRTHSDMFAEERSKGSAGDYIPAAIALVVEPGGASSFRRREKIEEPRDLIGRPLQRSGKHSHAFH
jgi:hypothetical protein